MYVKYECLLSSQYLLWAALSGFMLHMVSFSYVMESLGGTPDAI